MNLEKTKVILAGAGPGDPGLITLKAVEALKRADIVIYDFLANDQLLRFCRSDAEKIYVGKRAGHHSLSQEEITKLIIEKARSANLVVRLKGGDPFVFGRGGEEALALQQAGISFEVIPGVTSGTAVLCYAGIPATHRGMATSVSFITGHEDPTKETSGLNWSAIAKLEGTLVFYMGVKNLSTIVENLIFHGKSADTPVALIRWGTLPVQQTLIGTLETIAPKAKLEKFQPPALIVVGEVVKLRSALNWFERKPLFGRRIVITRSRAQSSQLTQELMDLGAQVIEFPTIAIAPPDSYEPLDEAIHKLADYDWLVFTSVNGVTSFADRLAAHGLDSRALAPVKISAIGPATARQLEQMGIRADLQPEKYVAESLLDALEARESLRGKRFLLARSKNARVLLCEKLREKGAEVDEVVAYKTVLERSNKLDLIDALHSGKIDAVTFTSSSTVDNFIQLLGEDAVPFLRKTALASIGPITARTLEKYGLHSTIIAEEFTIPGLVNALVDYFNNPKRGRL